LKFIIFLNEKYVSVAENDITEEMYEKIFAAKNAMINIGPRYDGYERRFVKYVVKNLSQRELKTLLIVVCNVLTEIEK